MPAQRNLPSPYIVIDVDPADKAQVIFLMELDGYVVGERVQADGKFTIIGHLP